MSVSYLYLIFFFFFFQAEDGIRDGHVTGVQTCALPILFFLNHPDTQQWFKDYISMLLNRVNTATGIAYKDEPAIFAWQIMNEGRNPGEDPMILRNWYAGMARYIKSIAPNHMRSEEHTSELQSRGHLV